MANKVLVTKSKLDLLADSVSAKSGVSLPLTIAEMKIAVDGIQLNTQIIGDGDLEVDENDYLYFDEDGEIVLGTKTITQNGTYTASSDNLSGYSLVTVNVPSGGSGNGTAIITDTTDAAGGTIRTITTTDEVHLQTKTITPTSTQQTVLPDTGYDGFSSVVVGASSGGGSPSATQHTIHLEFSDSTETDIEIYHDDSLLESIVTNYIPVNWSYSNKTVVLAQLDGVTWYDRPAIPLNTQLVDYTKVKLDYGIDDATGEEEAAQWMSCSDYTPINSTMTFSYVNYKWYTIHYYDMKKAFMSYIKCEYHNDTIDSNDYAHGTLNSSNIPPNAGYVRFTCSYGADNNAELSLIRTA